MVLSIVRLVYSLLFVLILPIIFCRLIYKGRRLPGYRARWAERLGFVSFIADKKNPLKPIWIHAASLGEVVSAIPLVRGLQSQYSNTPIVITTMTPTGSEQVQLHFKNELNHTVFHSYVPYDIGWVVHRFFKGLRPIALIIMETELWPNLLGIAHQQKIPIVIANARLSPKSVTSYRRLGWFMKAMLNEVTVVAAQSKIDEERYASLGLERHKIIYTGNLKYDLKVPEGVFEQGAALRRLWDHDNPIRRPVWIAASTHPGEERIVLSIFLKLQKKWPTLLLVVVPRHPERFEEVYQLCLKEPVRVIRATDLHPVSNPEVFLGDTMGELWKYYAASDIVFLGGSLVPIGGHNFLEPAALGLPIVTGPHLLNCSEIAKGLQETQGLKIVNSAQALEEQVQDFLQNPVEAKRQGQAAQRFVAQNRGALARLLKVIGDCLSGNH